jgi:hypothetical protein
MMNKTQYPIDSPQMDRFIKYNFILAWIETFRKRCLINSNEYSKAIEETNKLYSDVSAPRKLGIYLQGESPC